MRILIADKFSSQGVDALREQGHEVTIDPGLGADTLPAALSETNAQVLVVRSTKVQAPCFEGGLGLVIRAGAGVNTIDLETASAKKIPVANCPGKNAIAVAELAFGLMLALDRFVPDAVADVRAGKWNKKKYGKGRGLFGRRLGLVGFGAIAREVGTRGKAFGMKVSTFDPFVNQGLADEMGATVVGDLEELLANSDVVSIHVPYGKSTHHLMGAEQLAALPDGAYLIHTARGGVVDDAALGKAVASGRIRAGIDVYEEEPASGEAPFENSLREHAGLYGTPHIGASTEQATEAVGEEVLRIIGAFAADGTVHNQVNETA